MQKFHHLKIFVAAVFLLGLSGCQSVRDISNIERAGGGRETQEKKENAWIKREALIRATQEEIAIASAGEVRFVGTKALIPDRSLSVVFKMGATIPVGGVGVSNLVTTSSFYEVKNTRSGKSLLKTESTVTTGTIEEGGFKQEVLISQDGTRLLIYETWCGGDGSHDVYALVTKISEYDVWEVKYLKLPQYDGFDGIPEHGSTPVGFAGDNLIFEPLLSGRVFKKKLSEIEEIRNPLPFTRG